MSAKTRAIKRQQDELLAKETIARLMQENARLMQENAVLQARLREATPQRYITRRSITAEEMQAREKRQWEERKRAQILTPQAERSRARQNQAKIAKVQREAIERRNETTSIRVGDVVLYKGSEMSVLAVSPVGAILTLEHPATGILNTPAEKAIFLRKS